MRTDALTPDPEFPLNTSFDHTPCTFLLSPWITLGLLSVRTLWPMPMAMTSNAEIENPPEKRPFDESKRVKASSSNSASKSRNVSRNAQFLYRLLLSIHLVKGLKLIVQEVADVPHGR